MLRPSCILVTLLLVSPLVTAEIFKCSRENGSTVYQNFPCAIDSIGSQATAAPPPEQPAPAAAPEAPPVRAKKVAEAVPTAGAGRTEPRVGMSKAQVKASTWGDPIDMVKEEVVEGWTEVWHYDYSNKRTVVFGTNRRVSEVTQ